MNTGDIIKTSPENGHRLFRRLPKDILMIIMTMIGNKDAVVLTVCVNKRLKKYLCLTVDWWALIERDFWWHMRDHEIFSKYTPHRPPLNIREIIRCKTPIGKYYLLSKEKHECKFGMPEFGTCDSLEQLLEKFPKYRGPLEFSSVHRSAQPKRNGWRWHKWGEYCGELRCGNDPEYLYDANGKRGNPLIDVTYVFARYSQYPTYIVTDEGAIPVAELKGMVWNPFRNRLVPENK